MSGADAAKLVATLESTGKRWTKDQFEERVAALKANLYRRNSKPRGGPGAKPKKPRS